MKEKHITDAEFESKISGSSLPVLVDFYADWCGPCKRVSPIVAQIADENEGKVEVYKVNVDDCPDTAANLGISSIPTLIFFKNGKEIERVTGVRSKEAIMHILESLM